MSQVEVYGRPGCSNCEQAKMKLYRSGVKYEYLMLDDKIDELSNKFDSLPRSLPYIVYNDTMYTYNQLSDVINEYKKEV